MWTFFFSMLDGRYPCNKRVAGVALHGSQRGCFFVWTLWEMLHLTTHALLTACSTVYIDVKGASAGVATNNWQGAESGKVTIGQKFTKWRLKNLWTLLLPDIYGIGKNGWRILKSFYRAFLFPLVFLNSFSFPPTICTLHNAIFYLPIKFSWLDLSLNRNRKVTMNHSMEWCT